MQTFADLFCGIGGFHYAAQNVGMTCVFACDIDDAAQAQYESNFGITPEGDIRAIPAESIPDHDLLFAGFPCQPFSIIGSRKGLRDRRGTLAFEIIRVLEEKHPSGFVLENVRQFSSMKGGAVIQTLLKELRGIGYSCSWNVLNALHFGLPQKRERTIIVGVEDPEAMARFVWPPRRKTYKPLSDVLERNPDERFTASTYIKNKRKAAHTASITPSIWHENKGGNIASHPYSCALRAGASYNYLLVDGERRLTPREMLRLQGFPENFDIIGSDSQIRRQAGNAVPVPMVQAVIEKILDATTITQRFPEARAIPA